MRYLVFAGAAYYAAGGARDLIDASDSLDDATEFAESIIGMVGVVDDEDSCKLEWSHVLDLETKTIIAKFGDRPYGRSFGGDMVKILTL
jgi:hypothetical protein